MTSRERVRRALEFDRPDRVPRDLWALPIADQQHGKPAMDDFRRRWPVDLAGAPGVDPAKLGLTRGDWYAIGTFRDEWGCEFDNIHGGVIGQVKRPLLDDWSKLDDLRPPIEMLTIDADAANRFCAQTDKFVMAACCPRPFERAQFLRGSETLYCDLGEESTELKTLLSRIHEFYLKELEVWANTDVDALSFMDDWGSQRALLISPAQWRRLFKPLYADYAAVARAAGKKLFMHTDGYIFDIYQDLIDIGVDAVNSQLFTMDIEEIGRRYRGQIAFWGEIDRQHVLCHAAVPEVRAAVSRVIDNLYRPEGGVIAQFELTAGAKLENGEAIFQTWQELTGR